MPQNVVEIIAQGIDRASPMFEEMVRASEQAGERAAEAFDGLEDATDAAAEAAEGAAQRVGEAWQQAGSDIKGFGEGLTKNVTLPLAAAGAGALLMAGSFDSAYDNIRVGTGATGDALLGLQDDFRAVFESVPAGFEDVSTAIADYNTLLGLSGPPLQDLARQTLELSRITDTDLTANVDAAAHAFNNWNVATADHAGTMDMFFRVSQASGVAVTELIDNVTRFGPQLREMGLGLEEGAALLAAMDRAGIDSSRTMMGMSAAAGHFAQEGKTLAQGIQETFARIKELGPGAEATGLAMETFGSRSGLALADAITSGKLAVEDMMAAVENTDETILEAAAATDDWVEKLKLMGKEVLVAAEPLVGQLWEALNDLMPLFERGVIVVSKIIGWMAKLPKPVLIAAGAIAAIAAAAGPIFVVLGTVISSVGTVIGLFGGAGAAAGLLGGALAVITGPVGIAVAAIVGLIAVVTLLWKNSETFRDIVIGAWDAVKAGVGKAIDGVLIAVQGLGKAWEWIKSKTVQAWNAIVALVAPVVAEIRETIQVRLIDPITALWEAWGDDILRIARVAWDAISTQLKIAWAVISTAATVAWGVIKAVIGTAWGIIKSIVSGALTVISNVIQLGLNLIQGDWSEAWDNVKGIFEGFKTAIVGSVEAMWNGIKALFQVGIDAVKGVAQRLLSSILPVFLALKERAEEAVSEMWEKIKGVFTGAIDAVRDTMGQVRDAITGAMTAIQQKVSEAWDAVRDAVLSKIQAIVNAVLPAWLAIRDAVANAMEATRTAVSEKWEAILTAIAEKITAIRDAVAERWTAIRDAVAGAMDSVKTAVAEKWDTVRTAVLEKITAIRDAIPAAWDAIKTAVGLAMDLVKTAISQKWDDVKATVIEKWTAIKDAVAEHWGLIKEALAIAMDLVKTTILEKWDQVKTAVAEKVALVIEAVRTGLSTLRSAVETALSGLSEPFSVAWAAAKQVVYTAIEEIKGVVSRGMNEVLGTVTRIWDKLPDPIQRAADRIVHHSIVPEMVKAVVGEFIHMERETKQHVQTMANEMVTAFGVSKTAALEWAKEVDATTKALERANQTLGLSERELLAYELATKNATRAQIEAALRTFDDTEAKRANAEMLENLNRLNEENARTVEGVIAGLEREGRELNMTSEELLTYTLSQAGASAADIERALALGRANEATVEAQRVASEHAETVKRTQEEQAQAVEDAQVRIADKLADMVDNHMPGWIQDWKGHWDKVKEIATAFGIDLGPIFEGLKGIFGTWIGEIGTILEEGFSGIFKRILGGIGDWLGEVKGLWGEAAASAASTAAVSTAAGGTAASAAAGAAASAASAAASAGAATTAASTAASAAAAAATAAANTATTLISAGGATSSGAVTGGTIGTAGTVAGNAAGVGLALGLPLAISFGGEWLADAIGGESLQEQHMRMFEEQWARTDYINDQLAKGFITQSDFDAMTSGIGAAGASGQEAERFVATKQGPSANLEVYTEPAPVNVYVTLDGRDITTQVEQNMTRDVYLRTGIMP